MQSVWFKLNLVPMTTMTAASQRPLSGSIVLFVLLEHSDHCSTLVAAMWWIFVVLLSCFEGNSWNTSVEFQNMFPVHHVPRGVWAVNTSYQVSGKRRERGSMMDGG